MSSITEIMEIFMKRLAAATAVSLFFIGLVHGIGGAQELELSAETEDCLGCHEYTHPGLVASWLKSRHSRVTPAQGMETSRA